VAGRPVRRAPGSGVGRLRGQLHQLHPFLRVIP